MRETLGTVDDSVYPICIYVCVYVYVYMCMCIFQKIYEGIKLGCIFTHYLFDKSSKPNGENAQQYLQLCTLVSPLISLH